mgnify:FL=1
MPDSGEHHDKADDQYQLQQVIDSCIRKNDTESMRICPLSTS